MSVINTNPSTWFGGTWERIQDRFLLAAGSSYAANSTGGNSTINLQHSHTVNNHNHAYGIRYQTFYGSLVGNDGDAIKLWNGSYWTSLNGGAITRSVTSPRNSGLQTSSATQSGISQMDVTTTTGNASPGTNNQLSTAQNILPPYLAVYIWKRTA